MSEVNPYQTPSAAVDDEPSSSRLVKSSRGVRLGAALLDGLTLAPAGILIGIGSFDENDPSFVLIGLGFLLGLGTLAYICYLVYTNGQTIGKKMVSIKVVRTNGERASFARILFFRNFFPMLIGAIPLVGTLFSLADPLFIFNQHKRCIHDYFADTIVIKA